jgi:hypothetical protein
LLEVLLLASHFETGIATTQKGNSSFHQGGNKENVNVSEMEKNALDYSLFRKRMEELLVLRIPARFLSLNFKQMRDPANKPCVDHNIRQSLNSIDNAMKRFMFYELGSNLPYKVFKDRFCSARRIAQKRARDHRRSTLADDNLNDDEDADSDNDYESETETLLGPLGAGENLMDMSL